MNRIGDYALIGDCHSAALVGSDGSIDWACFPRFDSPAIFCRALDEQRGGSFAVTPADAESVERAYIDGTNVLQTTFRCAAGTLELSDCMPVTSIGRDPRDMRTYRSLLRRLSCTDGEVDVEVSVAPRFDYGRFVPHFRLTSEESAEAVGGADALHITATRLLDEERECIKARWHLRAGEIVWIEAAWGPSLAAPKCLRSSGRSGAAAVDYDETVAFWNAWNDRCVVDVADEHGRAPLGPRAEGA